MGCVYQSLNISKLYFSYETVTNVKYETHKTIQLPGINFCYNKKDQALDLYKELVYKNISTEKYPFYNFNKNFTIRDQFGLFYGKPILLIACSISSTHLPIDCLSVANLTQSLGELVYCFKLFQQSIGVSDERYVIHQQINVRKITILLNKTAVNVPGEYGPVLLKIGDRKRKEYQLMTEDQMILDLNKTDFCRIKYSKFVVNYLFEPKGRPCFEGLTKEECEDKCNIHRFIEKTGQHPSSFLTWNITSDLKIYGETENRKFDLDDKCDSQCSGYTECYKEYYISKAEHHSLGIPRPEENYHLEIYFPSHPTTIYEISLKMSFEEYLCLIASILSLWFGFSILDFPQNCHKIIKISKQKIIILNPNDLFQKLLQTNKVVPK